MKCLKNKIVIFGAGSFAREAYHLCQVVEVGEVLGFIAPKQSGNETEKLLPIKMLGTDGELSMLIDTLKINTFVSAIGHPGTRKKCFDLCYF